MPSYKAWIYTVNISIITVEIILLVLAILTYSDPQWSLIPLSFKDTNIQIYSLLIALQIFTCICGLVGVWLSQTIFLKIYWIFMIPLAVMDLVMLFPFVEQFSYIHSHYDRQLRDITIQQIQNRDPLCQTWKQIEADYNCCAPVRVQNYCSKNSRRLEDLPWTSTCEMNNEHPCNIQLLRWMHSHVDIIAILIYYILLPLKCIVFAGLRDDIKHIFSRRAFSVWSKYEIRFLYKRFIFEIFAIKVLLALVNCTILVSVRERRHYERTALRLQMMTIQPFLTDWDTEDEEEFEMARHLAPFVKREALEEMVNETHVMYGA